MPKIRPLTAEGRRAEELTRLAKRLQRDAVGTRAVNRETLTHFADKVGISVGSAHKFAHGETIMMTAEQWLRLADYAGYELTERNA